MVFVPAPYSLREVEFWRKRFDQTRFLTIAEIEKEFGLDRSNYSGIQIKLKSNLENGILDLPREQMQGNVATIRDQTQELLELAQETTEITGALTPDLVDLIIRTRAYQVNWERQRQRYQRRE
jgi:hypothetical protein